MKTNAEYAAEFSAIALEQKRVRLREAFGNLEEKHQAVFNRMYGSIEQVSEREMPHAYSQIMRTLERNAEEPKP